MLLIRIPAKSRALSQSRRWNGGNWSRCSTSHLAGNPRCSAALMAYRSTQSLRGYRRRIVTRSTGLKNYPAWGSGGGRTATPSIYPVTVCTGVGRGWKDSSPRIVQRRRYKEPKWPDSGPEEVGDKSWPNRLRETTLCWWGRNQHDVAQSPSELMIEATKSEDPMPGPTAQRDKDKSWRRSPQARKNGGAGITYFHMRVGSNGKVLQARTSMSSVMLTLNHDDISKNLVW